MQKLRWEERVVTSRVTTDFQDTGTIWDQESLKQQEALYVLLSQIWEVDGPALQNKES